jgi:hypothetical protein
MGGCGAGGSGLGGAVAAYLGTCYMENCTITRNLAIGAGSSSFGAPGGQTLGSGIYSGQGTFGTINSIVAGNFGTNDAYGNFSSQGHNLFEITNGMVGLDATDLRGVDPRLGPLQDNGGPTLTHALLSGSPAIDAGAHTAVSFDQRGEPRPVDNPAVPNASGGDGSDIGALEVDPVLRCTSVQRQGNDILVKVTSVSDGAYTIQYRSNANAGVWTTLTGSVSGSGGIITVTNAGAGVFPQRVYRGRKL